MEELIWRDGIDMCGYTREPSLLNSTLLERVRKDDKNCSKKLIEIYVLLHNKGTSRRELYEVISSKER